MFLRCRPAAFLAIATAAIALVFATVAAATSAPRTGVWERHAAATAGGKHRFQPAHRISNRIRVQPSRLSRAHPESESAATAGADAGKPGKSTPSGKSTPPSKPGNSAPPPVGAPSVPTPPPGPLTEPGTEPVEPPTEVEGGRLIFSSNFDAGFSDWHVQSLAGRATISSANSFAGSGAARFEVQPGDVEPETGSNRSEVSGPTFNAGEDLYFRDEIRIPSNTTYYGPWQIIQQLHESEWGGSPGIAVFLNSSHALQLGAGDGSPTYWRSSGLETDRWYELVYRVQLSQDAAQGFVEVWLDGAPQRLLNGATRMYGQTIQTARTYLKLGIYRDPKSQGTSLIEHDEIAVGTSLAAVVH